MNPSVAIAQRILESYSYSSRIVGMCQNEAQRVQNQQRNDSIIDHCVYAPTYSSNKFYFDLQAISLVPEDHLLIILEDFITRVLLQLYDLQQASQLASQSKLQNINELERNQWSWKTNKSGAHSSYTSIAVLLYHFSITNMYRDVYKYTWQYVHPGSKLWHQLITQYRHIMT